MSQPPKLKLRQQFIQPYITSGRGIEIGPTFLPVSLPTSVKVTYVDVMSKTDLLKLYPDLKNKPVVDIDVIDDAEKLQKFSDQSQNFIIANHFIEHTQNPLQTIVNFLRVLKPGGYIMLAVPDRRATFDKDRQLTSIKHLIQTFKSGCDNQIEAHYRDCVKNIEKLPAQQIDRRVKHLQKKHFSIHYHTFQLNNFLPLINHLQHQGYPLNIIDSADLGPQTDEFIVLLQKTPSWFQRIRQSLSRALSLHRS